MNLDSASLTSLGKHCARLCSAIHCEVGFSFCYDFKLRPWVFRLCRNGVLLFVFYYFINISVTSKDFEEATALKKSIEMLGQTKKRLV